jgi:hypothetical protein
LSQTQWTPRTPTTTTPTPAVQPPAAQPQPDGIFYPQNQQKDLQSADSKIHVGDPTLLYIFLIWIESTKRKLFELEEEYYLTTMIVPPLTFFLHKRKATDIKTGHVNYGAAETNNKKASSKQNTIESSPLSYSFSTSPLSSRTSSLLSLSNKSHQSDLVRSPPGFPSSKKGKRYSHVLQ